MEKELFLKRLKIAIGTMLIIAILYLPYVYYEILRAVVCFGAIYCFAKERAAVATWINVSYIIIAVLFNPFLPFYLDRGSWLPIDLVAGAIMLYSALIKPEEKMKEKQPPQ